MIPEQSYRQPISADGIQQSGPSADQYKGALARLRGGDFEGAKGAFSAFIEQNPGTAFTDNGLFWLGICYSKLGQYDRAIVSFSDVFQSYPAEDMVPASLYYLAETFVKTNSHDDAILTLEKLREDHPKSKFAAKARKRIAEIKKLKRRRR